MDFLLMETFNNSSFLFKLFLAGEMEMADLTADALPDDQDQEDPEIRKLEGGKVKIMIENIHFYFFFVEMGAAMFNVGLKTFREHYINGKKVFIYFQF